ncbi:MAG: sigma-70 family RNA polymerase sigma factor [Verrucomicrobiota bacterium]
MTAKSAALPAAAFRPTRWSLIARAKGDDAGQAREALEKLCADYWFPLYACVRQRGHGPEDAQDLVQSFFVRLLERDTFAAACEEKGKLRSFLMFQLQNHLADAARHRSARKRGGHFIHFSLDDAESRLAREPVEADTPETLYHRRWAREVLARALHQLENQAAERGDAAAFTLLKPALTDATATALDTSAVAEALQIPTAHVKVRVHRLRAQFREAVLSVIAETLQTRSRSALEAEMRDLLQSLAAGG